VHRFPDRSRFDACFIQAPHQRVAIDAESLLVDEEDAEPIGVAPVRCLGHEIQPVHVRKGIAVGERDRTPLRYSLFEDLQLCSSDGREHV